jgi:hypothetical protein
MEGKYAKRDGLQVLIGGIRERFDQLGEVAGLPVEGKNLHARPFGALPIGFRIVADEEALVGGVTGFPAGELKDARMRLAESDFAGDDDVVEEWGEFEAFEDVVEASVPV